MNIFPDLLIKREIKLNFHKARSMLKNLPKSKELQT